MIKVLLISIGNELVSGLTVNSNVSFLGRELTQRGFSVRKILTIPDEKGIVVTELKEGLFSGEYKVIIVTGGLGPTWDDSTSFFLAEALGVPLSLNNEGYEVVKKRYQELFEKGLVESSSITNARKKMAFLPKGTAAIQNPVGTAPGISYYAPSSDTQLFCFPGIPGEMKAMFSLIIPHLEKMREKEGKFYFETQVTTSFTDESLLAPFLDQVKENYNVWIKSLPKTYQSKENIHLIISSHGSSPETTEEIVLNARNFLLSILKD
ncbi:MAG: molybdopterin-binding protein [Candidatus Hodarchaeales archaeon]|jgi:molybdenum cofactor synthesis domain-containing protein